MAAIPHMPLDLSEIYSPSCRIQHRGQHTEGTKQALPAVASLSLLVQQNEVVILHNIDHVFFTSFGLFLDKVRVLTSFPLMTVAVLNHNNYRVRVAVITFFCCATDTPQDVSAPSTFLPPPNALTRRLSGKQCLKSLPCWMGSYPPHLSSFRGKVSPTFTLKAPWTRTKAVSEVKYKVATR